MRKRKVERKEKPVREKYVPVRADNALIGKYLPVADAEGFDLAHAEALCAPVGADRGFVPLPVPVRRWVVANRVEGPVTEVLERFAAEGAS